MTKQITVTVKKFFVEKGFGFFQRPEGCDVFVHITLLERLGFTPADMVETTEAVIDMDANGDRKQTVGIYRIGDKLAATRTTETKPMIRRNQKREKPGPTWVAGKAPELTLDMFYEVGEPIASCAMTGISLHEVRNTSGDFAQYVYCKGSVPLCSSGYISEVAAKVFLNTFAANLVAAE